MGKRKLLLKEWIRFERISNRGSNLLSRSFFLFYFFLFSFFFFSFFLFFFFSFFFLVVFFFFFSFFLFSFFFFLFFFLFFLFFFFSLLLFSKQKQQEERLNVLKAELIEENLDDVSQVIEIIRSALANRSFFCFLKRRESERSVKRKKREKERRR